MSKHLRNDIINHLAKKGNYEPSVDDYLIDIIIDNLEYASQARQELKQGLVIQAANGNGVISTRINPGLTIYETCLRNINQAAKQLGISRADRIKLKLLEEKKIDEFESDFN